jgi:hypothetical protein
MKSVVIGAHLRREDIIGGPASAGQDLDRPAEASHEDRPAEAGPPKDVPKALPVRDLWLSAIEIPGDQPLGDRELLLRVAAVRAKLLERATFLAVRYGFAVTSAGEAESKCAAHLERWKTLLEANRDRVEMTLKVAATKESPRPDRHEFTSGTAYLKALHEATTAVDVDPSFRDAVEQTLVPLAVRYRWQHRDNRSLELALLVGRERVDDVRRAGEELKKTDVPFLLSGPWPLEVFADDDHE